MRAKRNGLRPCKINRGGNCFTPNCYFHSFATVGNSRDGITPVAIVEAENGEVHEYDASSVIFEDIG